MAMTPVTCPLPGKSSGVIAAHEKLPIGRQVAEEDE
jgi:hypothetical protein